LWEKKGIEGKKYEERYNALQFATKSAAAEDTGLGLLISKSLVEAHGGKIWAENDRGLNEGDNGATFYFTLPILTTTAVNDN